MEILRLAPYPLIATWTLPEANYPYIVYVEDLVEKSFQETTITSSSTGVINYEIPFSEAQLDRELLVRFYDEDHEELVYEETLDIIRPYTNPNLLGSTATEIAEFTMYEMIARSIIDTYINDDFNNHKTVIQAVGQGTDYFSIWEKAHRVLKVYENNELIYDISNPSNYTQEFKITLDSTAIVRTEAGSVNRAEKAHLTLPGASGDFWFYNGDGTAFNTGYDYIFVLDTGYKTIPTDVEYATKLLIDDLKCGRLEYYKRYTSDYSTDQYKIKFDKLMMSGTGNMLVDRILDKYVTTIVKPGII